MVLAGDFRNGTTFEMDGNVYRIVEFQHVKQGKSGAFVRTKLRDLRTGSVNDITFTAGEKMEQAIIEKKSSHFALLLIRMFTKL